MRIFLLRLISWLPFILCVNFWITIEFLGITKFGGKFDKFMTAWNELLEV